MYTRARQYSLFQAKYIQCIPLCTIQFRCILILTSHLRPDIFSNPFLYGSNSCYKPYQYRPLWLDPKSYTFTLYSSLNISDQVSHQHKTTDKIKVAIVEVFTALTMKNAVFWDIETQFVPHRNHIISPLKTHPVKAM
jgi:hypothetical protein